MSHYHLTVWLDCFFFPHILCRGEIYTSSNKMQHFATRHSTQDKAGRGGGGAGRGAGGGGGEV